MARQEFAYKYSLSANNYLATWSLVKSTLERMYQDTLYRVNDTFNEIRKSGRPWNT